MTQKIYVSYSEYEILLNGLTREIQKNPISKSITHVFGIPRGGLPIAIHLAHKLKLEYLHSFDDYWEVPHAQKLLICDDVADTGTTFKRYLRDDVMDMFLTASLHYKTQSIIRPDFFAERTEDWIVYPWELDEETPSNMHLELYSDIFRTVQDHRNNTELHTIAEKVASSYDQSISVSEEDVEMWAKKLSSSLAKFND